MNDSALVLGLQLYVTAVLFFLLTQLNIAKIYNKEKSMIVHRIVILNN